MSIGQTSDEGRLASVIERFSERKVLVVGDMVADQFLYGEISRVSREAPVFILRHERTETVPGGAANCAVNLASLGARVSLLGLVGTDETGRALLDRLRAVGVNTSGIVTSSNTRTTTKVRVLAGQAHSTRQQVIRVDYEPDTGPQEPLLAEIRQHFTREIEEADAVIVSDYNYGVADEQTVRSVREATKERGIPVFVDSRFRLAHFPHFTSATPNEAEVEQVIGHKLSDVESLREAGRALRERLDYEALLITRGGRGLILFEREREPLELEAVGSSEPVDGTGAGDTVIATYALSLASGASFTDGARLANHAGGLVVMKRGTASITSGELLASVLSV